MTIDDRSVKTDAPRERVSYDRLIAYYEEAGPDFGQWSRGFNMHFGFYRLG
jgi:hypothetical protein